MTLRNNLVQALNLYTVYTTETFSIEDRKGEMKAIFNAVADEDKTFVFGTFLQFLRDEGIQPDVTFLQSA